MKQTTRFVLAAVAVAAPAFSMAAAGNITFNGQVTDQTCEVHVNGVDNAIVTLPTVGTGQLAAAAETAGLTSFKVQVTNCKSPHTQLGLSTQFSNMTVSANGNLVNTVGAGGAQNVELQLLSNFNDQSTAISLQGITPVPGLSIAENAAGGEQEFGVQYYATGQSTAGPVQAVVNYDIVYP